ncbi:Chondroadherin-like protein [Pseudolycoriella hygida]|uniref:Chondroadherin-like protein n=1 Tax=Pseudolycoriella hygida TaxID=35572 RepID=A0A9Q0S9K7_9DIPT|nr:Chondroadherin-like protein [Pseudolycoriella hygida]
MTNRRIANFSALFLVLVYTGQLCEAVNVYCARDWNHAVPSICTILEFPLVNENDQVSIVTRRPELAGSLYIENNNMMRLYGSFFETFPNLNRVVISNTRVSRINRADLQKAVNVEDFDFNRNRIEEIEDFSFSGLNKATQLNLRGNKLVTIRRNTFDGLINLKNIYLGGNPLKTIEDGALNFPQLGILSLEGTKLTTLSRNFFQVNPPLRECYMSGDSLTTIGDFFNGMKTTLSWIDLNGNPIDDLSFSKFAIMPVLRYLYIAKTPFKNVNEDDEASAKSAESNLVRILVSEDQLSHDFITKVHRIFKNLSDFYIQRTEHNVHFTDEDIKKIIPGVHVYRFN